MQKNSMPKLCEVLGRTKTKIFGQFTICLRCVLAALRTIKQGLTEVNKAKPLRYSGKKLYFIPIQSGCSNIIQPPTLIHSRQHSRDRRVFKNARLLPDDYCSLNKTSNKILFKINWQRVNQGFKVAPQEEVHLCEVR